MSRAILKDSTESTLAGLEYIQVGANKRSLEELCKSRDQALFRAREDYDKRKSNLNLVVSTLLTFWSLFIDLKAYQRQKEETKRLLSISTEKIGSIDDELRIEFQNMERDIDKATLEALEQDQEDCRAKLELIVITDPNVVMRYEERERKV